MHSYLGSRADVSSVELVVVEDHIDVAMLHYLLADHGGSTPAPAKLAVVSGQASLASAAKARLYSPVSRRAAAIHRWCVVAVFVAASTTWFSKRQIHG